MAPLITTAPAPIATTDYSKPEQGLLIFAAGALVAVVSQLDGSVAEDEDDTLRGRWFLEAGFGPCAVPPSDQCIFASREEAEEWVVRQLAEAE